VTAPRAPPGAGPATTSPGAVPASTTGAVTAAALPGVALLRVALVSILTGAHG